MPNKMLIDATHPEETRVVVVRGNRVEEFDFESAQRKQLRGNIYLAKVTRVEPSLQAAFIEYGGNRHGFLAFSEIHPDYYQIPVADRQALIEADERAHREAEEDADNRSNRRRSRHRNSRRRGHGERVQSEVVDAANAEQIAEGMQVGDHAPDSVAEGAPDSDQHAHNEHVQRDEPEHHEETSSIAAEPTAVAAALSEAEAQDHHDDDHGHEDHEDHAMENAAHAEPEPAQTAVPLSEERHGDDAHDHEEDSDEAEEEIVESVGGDDVLEEVPERAFRPRRQYKIQEVIKRRQVMLVQVVKEERGNKGAALTTYLSLAGRYAVLMPNTARGGGISRKITSAQDRSRLKDVVQDLDVPEGMGIILRTAGASRTKPEIKRDFEYLIRMWETVRDMTLKSQAPTLVYEEGSLIKRSLRDLYNKEIDEVLVAGEGGYNEARDFMKMLMPSNVRAVKQYRDGQPLFSRMGIEAQLDAMFSPTVTLRSGGYIVINQTEALVSIDVNSGRSTREHHIEDTALKTNLEAAEEVARQLRLRDLAGLIVIDFIDMDEKRNNRSVERKLSDCLRQDRARIQVGRISHFGLLEMSRQRIRASVLESSTEPCPHCGGSGHVRSVASVALQLLRGLEENLMKGATHNLAVRTRTDVALYVLNHKRGHLRDLENNFKVTLAVVADPTISGQQSFVIERGEMVHTPEEAKTILAAQLAARPPEPDDTYEYEEDEAFEAEAEFEGDDEDVAEGQAPGEPSTDGDGAPRRKRRRRRRGGRGGEQRDQSAADGSADAHAPDLGEDTDEGEDDSDDAGSAQNNDVRAEGSNGERRPRRRGRRGGRRRRGNGDTNRSGEGIVATIADDIGSPPISEATDAAADLSSNDSASHDDHAMREASSVPVSHHISTPEDSPLEAEPPRKRSTVREKVNFFMSGGENQSEQQAAETHSPAQPIAPTADATPAQSEGESDQPRRAGWWSKRT
ncbi:MAG: Rne/Rng family ribonuclease [Afipia sp.]|nr:Rne/Rng family ribonuclease [Afipia sp.]